MPQSVMHLFKRDVCLQVNSLCFKALLASWWIFSSSQLHRCLWVCVCFSMLYVRKKKRFLCFHISLHIYKTDKIINKAHCISCSALIMSALMSCLNEWVFKILPIYSSYFQSLPIFWQHKETHIHVQGHKLECTLSFPLCNV